MEPLLLGYDIGSSFIKASLISANTGRLVASAVTPERELMIESPRVGFAEQQPDVWWQHVVSATRRLLSSHAIKTPDILSLGISYQMHGLVMVDKALKPIYPAIIWCDSRAVDTGKRAFADLGADFCLKHYLNSPGNFTASKLKWVRDHLPDVYSHVYRIMLPGDYIALRLTNELTTTISGLSEAILWDFESIDVADKLIEYYGISRDMIPPTVPSFSHQGKLTTSAANELGLSAGTPVSYRAGDQPNNALSLNVLSPGEAAATAGTSGVVYGVTKENVYDKKSRVNTFAHVNYTRELPMKGVLLCINGSGIQYSWMKHRILEDQHTYDELNRLAAGVEIGCRGLMCFPYGNGAERSLENRDVRAQLAGINFNIHDKRHLIRAAQEGIAFTFKYGLDILKSIGLEVHKIRVGNANLFQSEVFKEAFVNTCGVDLTVYNTDGSQGAARGAGIGVGHYSSDEEAFKGLSVVEEVHRNPKITDTYKEAYETWKRNLLKLYSLSNGNNDE